MKEKLPSPSPLLRPGLAEFLQVFHEDLVLEWERTLLARSPADWPHETLLREHLPGFLEQLAEALESPPSATRPPWPQAVPDEHALRCLEAGMSSERIALEFSLLRHCIHQGLVREGIEAGPAEWELLNESIDQGLIRVTALHANVRERMLKALERVSEVALESLEIDTFLNRLLRVLQEAAVSVDGASILLCEEEALRLRASVGLDSRQAVKADLHLTLDEGLSGEVVRGRGPHLVRMAAQHPAPRSDLVRQLGVRAIYSVPLRHGERLIGLAHMSSSTLFDFTPSDKLLFRAMMTRATSFLLRAELVEQEQ
ncbi:MAG: GAF domain-containing protein, partial [Cystobacter sp.]